MLINLVANSMLKAESEGKKPESYVWVQTAEGLQAVEEELAILCPTFDHEIKSGLGSSKDTPISVLPRVRATCLSVVFDYCRFYKVRRSFEVEKMESRGHSAFDSRIRLLEKLYKKKKQTVVKEIENLKNLMAGLNAGHHEDSRQVDDLVSFINGGDGETQTSKKKKNRKKRGQKKISSSITSSSSSEKLIENHAKDLNATDSAMARGPHADTSKLYGIQDESFKVQNYFDDNDMDHVLRQAIHREVVELARRFNLD
ncbi:SKP1-like protein 21 isoform X2 [Apium graveolens]|uniref:SKP1-like protein 21 isoform X2 n=1 Tax=Apium graveolens TaxID=4045 RepID=UPI003D79233F